MNEFRLECITCPYWWEDDVDNTCYCHYFSNDGSAPCEIDERESEECDDE